MSLIRFGFKVLVLRESGKKCMEAYCLTIEHMATQQQQQGSQYCAVHQCDVSLYRYIYP